MRFQYNSLLRLTSAEKNDIIKAVGIQFAKGLTKEALNYAAGMICSVFPLSGPFVYLKEE